LLWIVFFAACAMVFPAPFRALKPGIDPGLGIIMFGMGMTLTPADFRRVLRMPRAVLCGVVGQFLIMPGVAWVLVRVAGVDDGLALGFILLGACPGGTASNVIVYLARADVALSVTMTACSTLLAVLLTPAIVYVLGSAYVPVDWLALLKQVAIIVLLPVSAGLAIRVYADDIAQRLLPVFPVVSVFVIALIIACVVGLVHDQLRDAWGIAGLLVVLHNALGLALGYALAWLARLPPDARRTVAIEVGMQNSGLAVALAQKFPALTLAMLPGSLFSVWHNVTGSLLANWWRRRPLDIGG
jgi:BASS family bile acid:Na+ symporter